MAKVFVYYKDNKMKNYMPLSDDGSVTSKIIYAAFCEDSPRLRKALEDTVKENLKDGIKCSMQLRDYNTQKKVLFSVSWEDFSSKASVLKDLNFKKTEDQEIIFLNSLVNLKGKDSEKVFTNVDIEKLSELLEKYPNYRYKIPTKLIRLVERNNLIA